MRGKTFQTFDKFREAFWKEIGNDPALSVGFSSSNVTRMQNGLAPKVLNSQSLGKQNSYILHHKTPIQHNGGVYDMDNIIICTPRYHKEVLDPLYHF